MTTKDQRGRLISVDDVNEFFDEKAIRELAKTAKIGDDADLSAFRRSLISVAECYLVEAGRPQASEVREELRRLHTASRRALNGDEGAYGEVRVRLTLLSPEAREWLDGASPIPTLEDIAEPDRRIAALRQLLGSTVRGARWRPGRKRSGGRTSRPRLVPEQAGPPVRRGRPSNSAEVMLCLTLEICYGKATGRQAPLKTRGDAPGPFVRLLEGVLRRCGNSTANAANILLESRRWKLLAKARRMGGTEFPPPDKKASPS